MVVAFISEKKMLTYILDDVEAFSVFYNFLEMTPCIFFRFHFQTLCSSLLPEKYFLLG